MIALIISARSDGDEPFVTRLSAEKTSAPGESIWLASTATGSLWCGTEGLFELGASCDLLAGDVILVDPRAGRAERLIRAGSPHNSLLVTEQCDQLCRMCSQPPKKTHRDRFAHFETACLLADQGAVIGITGGEPTLHMEALLTMLERVMAVRPDLAFHVLSNGQHFTAASVERLKGPLRAGIVWGIPLYSYMPELHDAIVGKSGAFDRLCQSFALLLEAGIRIELRTVLLHENLDRLRQLARFVSVNLAHIEQWSLMGLENAGYAVRRWDSLHVDMRTNFEHVAAALDYASLHGVPARLFNIPLCHIPDQFRSFAVASISDWKQRFAQACDMCAAKSECSGFFEWHPDHLVEEVCPL